MGQYTGVAGRIVTLLTTVVIVGGIGVGGMGVAEALADEPTAGRAIPAAHRVDVLLWAAPPPATVHVPPTAAAGSLAAGGAAEVITASPGPSDLGSDLGRTNPAAPGPAGSRAEHGRAPRTTLHRPCPRALPSLQARTSVSTPGAAPPRRSADGVRATN